MCGIFGVLVRPHAQLPADRVEALLADLYRLSESRGKESAGLHAYLPETGQAWTLKAPWRGTELLRSPEYRRLNDQIRAAAFPAATQASTALGLLGHSRLVTNGTAALPRNNQPVECGRVTLVHNGIVVNVDALWRAHPGLERRADVDSEVMAALLDAGLSRGQPPAAATASLFGCIDGAASIAWMDDRRACAVLATNTGDLYFAEAAGCLAFASERYILEQALGPLAGPRSIQGLPAGAVLLADMNTPAVDSFLLTDRAPATDPPSLDRPSRREEWSAGVAAEPAVITRRADESLLRYSDARVRALDRCSVCVLPETFPFIDFDAGGVCNYCRHYQPRYLGINLAAARRRFAEVVAPFRRGDGTPDVLVAFSGGRDSSYGLHLLKTEFGLNPITFTFDWGMITDLARRNVARMCGRLGVQNILVSADIATKRDHIRRNVAAWLHRPDLGLVPMFMAGDKEFLRVANTLKRQTGIALNIWCASPLENTDFKVGCCGVPPDFGKSGIDSLSRGRQLRLASYYARGVLANPRYLNASLADTAKAFWSYYFEPRSGLHFLYDYVRWDEREVTSTLLDRYDWETAPDTTSTWRIGDGTAAFYNYIYVTGRGFSEFDTFRSNQIREGMLDRAAALDLVVRENQPRPEALRWYLDTIGIDFNAAIRAINTLDERGLHA